MKIAQEFKAFVLKGSVVEIAVGIIIGVAFGAVVTSLVEDLLTPLLGLLGSPDFSHLTVKMGDATLRYGEFLTSVITFLTIALTVFVVAVKPFNALNARRRTEPETPTTRPCPRCLSTIPRAADRCSSCSADIAPLEPMPTS